MKHGKNEEIDLLKVGLSGIVKRYGFQTVIFTKPLPFLKQLMPNIKRKPTGGKNFMVKTHKDRQKKAFINGYGIIKKKVQTDQ